MDGGTPVTLSTSGRGIVGKNCRAYGVSVSRKRRCPSAKTTSNASVLLPEPLGPVTTVSLPCGILTLTSCRLCSRACATTKFASGRVAASAGAALERALASCLHGRAALLALSIGKVLREGAPGARFAYRSHLAGRALGHHEPAPSPGIRAQIEHAVRVRDQIEIVLDDDHAAARAHDRVERGEHARHLVGVQAGARLVEHEQRALMLFAERARELQALRLAAGQRRQRLPKPQIAEPELCDRAERALHADLGRESARARADRHLQHVGDAHAPRARRRARRP